MRLCSSPDPLDKLLAMDYRVRCGPPLARIARPRERSFIVLEEHSLPARITGGACLYLVAKRGLSTAEAAARLSRLLGGQARYLGLKDAEATTVQLVCIEPCPGGAPQFIRLPGLWARLLQRSPRCPGRRSLLGNKFTIILEPLGGAPERICEELKRAAEAGLPAYYAYQRFGTRRPSTGHAALAALAAAHRFLWELLDYDYPDEMPETRRCRRTLWRSEACSGGYEAQLAPRPGRLLPRSIPGFVASIHSSALQALVFNAYLSERLRRGYDLWEPVPGERRGAGAPLAPVPGVGYRLRIGGEAAKILGEALTRLGLDEEMLEKPPPLLEKRRPYWRPVAVKPRRLACRVTGGMVVVGFSLDTGMYATLLLREVTGVEGL